jgi:hypothetical protein
LRTRSPPELKWLLVERATVAGDIARLDARQALLAAELAERWATLLALDTTIRLTEYPVAANAAGVIRSFAREYGRRGALKEFIVSRLRDASMAGISTRALAQESASHFGLNFATKAEFSLFQENSVRPQVTQLRKQGLVEVVHGVGKPQHAGQWRWKNPLPTFADLAALVAVAD